MSAVAASCQRINRRMRENEVRVSNADVGMGADGHHRQTWPMVPRVQQSGGGQIASEGRMSADFWAGALVSAVIMGALWWVSRRDG